METRERERIEKKRRKNQRFKNTHRGKAIKLFDYFENNCSLMMMIPGSRPMLLAWPSGKVQCPVVSTTSPSTQPPPLPFRIGIGRNAESAMLL